MSRVVRGIRNLISYAPVVWKDRDGDYEYLLSLMEFKLRRMRKVFATAPNASSESSQIEACATLCNRIRNGEYLKEHQSSMPLDKITVILNERERMVVSDLEALTTTIRKHIREWWL